MKMPRMYTRREKLSPENAAYLKRIERNQDDIVFSDMALNHVPFGLKTVIYRNEWLKRKKQLDEETVRTEEQKSSSYRIFEDMYEEQARQSMKDFVARVEHKKENVQHVLQYMLDDDDIQKALEPYVFRIRKLDTSLYGNLSPEERLLRSIFSSVSIDFANGVYTLIKRKRIPLDIWTNMLERHNKRFTELKKTFEEKLLPRLEKNFLDNVERLHLTRNDCLLPPLHVVREKLSRLQIDIQDGIEAKFDDRSGAYLSHFKRILLDSDLIDEHAFDKLEDVSVHEMNHALSGHMVISRDHPIMSGLPDEEFIIDHEIQIGFRRQGVFRWMNEGFTEIMTSYITGRPPSSYPDEVALCKYVASKGKKEIALNVFADAYYEDYDPMQKPTMPRWRALRTAISESFSPAFLMNLTKYIHKVGAAKALTYLENIGWENLA